MKPNDIGEWRYLLHARACSEPLSINKHWLCADEYCLHINFYNQTINALRFSSSKNALIVGNKSVLIYTVGRYPGYFTTVAGQNGQGENPASADC
ncbi:hypothetical protein MGMO_138c00120 [Methyloglobulus morosus KoM1]|uniref:Uncharacterized protein n=1 Tax=Methyloglobulus morosus KoM1 TaxID=1116472 RepID=V5BMZ7_9GAMM|nr:hypothetical protein MGMO_138c00120 [Methyloglobulus morosus KoM1]